MSLVDGWGECHIWLKARFKLFRLGMRHYLLWMKKDGGFMTEIAWNTETNSKGVKTKLVLAPKVYNGSDQCR